MRAARKRSVGQILRRKVQYRLPILSMQLFSTGKRASHPHVLLAIVM